MAKKETTVTEETTVSGYKVAAGKSIATMAGIKDEGEAVEAKHFVDGDETIADLMEKGFLEKA